MRTFRGTKASGGLAVGTIETIDRGVVGLHRIVCDPFRERALYEAAIVLAKDELQRLMQHATGDEADILIFQIALLEDESFTNEIGDYIAAGAGSAAAVERAEQIFAGRLNNVDDAYIRERSVDVRDACRRVVDILDGRPRRRLKLDRPSILAADVFFPSDLFSIDRDMILGIVSDNDSETSHAAIMARSMGIPALCRLGQGVAALANGCRAVLDAERGTLTLDPTPHQMNEARRRMVQIAHDEAEPDPLRDLPCRTRDGTPFILLASIDGADPAQARAAVEAGATGIGMVRTEQLCQNAPTEDAQYEAYVECLNYAQGQPVTFRTDGEIPAGQQRDWEQFRTQMRALLRARTEGDLRILISRVRSMREWDVCLEEIDRCGQELRERGAACRAALPIGCLIEVPAAALVAEELVEHGASFFAIDLQELARFICGVTDRDAVRAGRIDTTAIVRMVRQVVETVRGCGVPVYLSNISGLDLDGMPTFLHGGIRGFCTEPAFLSELKGLLLDTELKREEDLQERAE